MTCVYFDLLLEDLGFTSETVSTIMTEDRIVIAPIQSKRKGERKERVR